MLFAQSYLNLCNPVLCPWDSLGKNTGVGCHFLLQGNLPHLGIELKSPAWQVNSWPSDSILRAHSKDIQVTRVPWWSSGEDSELPMQGAPSLIPGPGTRSCLWQQRSQIKMFKKRFTSHMFFWILLSLEFSRTALHSSLEPQSKQSPEPSSVSLHWNFQVIF